jgi:hypothetical protein
MTFMNPFWHQVARLLGRVGILQRRLVDIARQNLPDPAFLDEYDGVMLLPAVAAEKGRVKSSVGIVRIEALAIERYPPRRRCSQGRVDMSGARQEAMQLERHERPVACATALVSRSAHKNQHCLKLVAAARFRPTCLRSKAPRSLNDRNGFAPRQLLSVFEADFQLDPDRERMRT